MFKQILRTTGLCIICYVLAMGIVWLLWPTLSEYTRWWPDWLPSKVSGGAAFFLFWTITHMQRGQMNPLNYPYMILYGIVCLAFCLSTVHHTQYNTGTAAMEMAFVIMLSWKIFQKMQHVKATV